MSDLNSYIGASEKFTAASDGIPQTDHSQQMNYGLEFAQRRAAEIARSATAEPPAVLKPIVPVAN